MATTVAAAASYLKSSHLDIETHHHISNSLRDDGDQDDDEMPFRPPSMMAIDVVMGLYDYHSTHDSCLSFLRGNVLHVINKDDSGWWDCICNGERGWIPSNFVASLQDLGMLSPVPSPLPSPPHERGGAQAVQRKSNAVDDSASELSDNPASPTKDRITHARQDPHTPPPEHAEHTASQQHMDTLLAARHGGDGGARSPRPHILDHTSPKHLAGQSQYSSVHSKLSAQHTQTVSRTQPQSSTFFAGGPLCSARRKSLLEPGSPRYQRPISPRSAEHVRDSKSITTVSTYRSAEEDFTEPRKDRLPDANGDPGHSTGNDFPSKPTWNQLVGNILSVIRELNQQVKTVQVSSYVRQVYTVSRVVKNLLLCSGTLSLGAHIVKEFGAVRSYQQALTEGVAKLVVAAKVASSSWTPPNAAGTLRHEAGQVLLGIRHFVSVAHELKLPLVSLEEGAKRRDFGTDMEEFEQRCAQIMDIELVGRIERDRTAILHYLNPVLHQLQTIHQADEFTIDDVREGIFVVGQLLGLLEHMHICQSTNGHSVSSFEAFCVAREKLYHHVDDLVTAMRSLMDQYAPANVITWIVSAVTTVIESTDDVTRTVKAVLRRPERIQFLLLEGGMCLSDQGPPTQPNAAVHIGRVELAELQRRASSLQYPLDNTATRTPVISLSPRSPPPYRFSFQGNQIAESRASILRSPPSYHSSFQSTSSDSTSRVSGSKSPNHKTSPRRHPGVMGFQLPTERPSSEIVGARLRSSLKPTVDRGIVLSPRTSSLEVSLSEARHSEKTGGPGKGNHRTISRDPSPSSRSAAGLSLLEVPDGDESRPTSFSREVSQASPRTSSLRVQVKKSDSSSLPSVSAPQCTSSPQEISPVGDPPQCDVAEVNQNGHTDIDQSPTISRSPTCSKATRYSTLSLSPASARLSCVGNGDDASRTPHRRTVDLSAVSVSQEVRGETAKIAKFFGEDVSTVAATRNSEILKVAAHKPWYLSYDYNSEDVTFNMEGKLSSGTLEALVERLTLHDAVVDASYLEAFMLTFRCFMTPLRFCELLIERFLMQPPPGLDDAEAEDWTMRKLQPVRLRVFNIIKGWLDNHFIDGVDDAILKSLSRFREGDLMILMPHAAYRLNELIQRRLEIEDSSLGSTKSSTKYTDGPAPLIPRGFSTQSRGFHVQDVNPLEIARQLTIMETRVFLRIRVQELLMPQYLSENRLSLRSSSGSDPPRNTRFGPNVTAMSTMSTHLTGWVSESIVTKPDPKKRIRMIKFWIKVCDRCLGLNNLDAVMAILSALNSSTIGRLKKTWELISSKTRATLDSVKQITDHSRNHSRYRQHLRSLSPPCLPFLGLYLTDLTFVHEGNPTFRPRDTRLVNFDKSQLTSRILQEIRRFQSPYQLVEVPELQRYISECLASASKKNADDLYHISLYMEPRASSTNSMGTSSPLTPPVNGATQDRVSRNPPARFPSGISASDESKTHMAVRRGSKAGSQISSSKEVSTPPTTDATTESEEARSRILAPVLPPLTTLPSPISNGVRLSQFGSPVGACPASSGGTLRLARSSDGSNSTLATNVGRGSGAMTDSTDTMTTVDNHE